MRDKSMTPKAGELMGKAAQEKKSFSIDDLPNLLGEKSPSIELSRVGRIRLVRALKQRFGADYKHIKAASDVLSDFDKKYDVERVIRKNLRDRKVNG